MPAPPLVKPLFRKFDGTMPKPKIVMIAVEGWGKTTMGAQVPGTAMLMAGSESGYKTLASTGQAPILDIVQTDTWDETMEVAHGLKNDTEHTALTIDELVGLQQQLFRKECKANFEGKWDKFFHYQKGPDACVEPWSVFLAALEQSDKMIVALCHYRIENFHDPDNEDYSRYTSGLNGKLWYPVLRWATASLFGKFDSVVKKGKGLGGSERKLHNKYADAVMAKNMYDIPDEITMPSDKTKMWDTIAGYFKGANA